MMSNREPWLTERQAEYFETMRLLDPSPETEQMIQSAKEQLRVRPFRDAEVVRGVSRVPGFVPNLHRGNQTA